MASGPGFTDAPGFSGGSSFRDDGGVAGSSGASGGFGGGNAGGSGGGGGGGGDRVFRQGPYGSEEWWT